MQETAISVQMVPGMRFLVFDSGCTRPLRGVRYLPSVGCYPLLPLPPGGPRLGSARKPKVPVKSEAMSGTEIAYAAYRAMRCPAVSGTEIAYAARPAIAMRRPVLTWRMVLPGCTVLTQRMVLPGCNQEGHWYHTHAGSNFFLMSYALPTPCPVLTYIGDTRSAMQARQSY
eukprot:2382352-Rhodomonas_salina.1